MQRLATRCSLAIVMALGPAACAVTPADPGVEPITAASEERLHGACPPGEMPDEGGDTTASGKPIRGCVPIPPPPPPDFATGEVLPTPMTTAPTQHPARPIDVCDFTPVPVPDVLSGYGCTSGITVDGQPIWACKSASAAPAIIGAVSTTLGTCAAMVAKTAGQGLGDGVAGTCEAPSVIPLNVTSVCFGAPAPGYEFIIDAIGSWGAHITFDPIIKGGCPGGCAFPVPPLAAP